MEIVNLNIVGEYYYKPNIEITSYDNRQNNVKECVICKRSLYDPSYTMISDNKNILNDTEILIGKCGHIFHSDCLNGWLKTNYCCPIDKIKWSLHCVADTTTNLVVDVNNIRNNNYKKFKRGYYVSNYCSPTNRL